MKRILKDTAIYGLSGALVKFSALLTLPVYARVLTPQEFGLLDLYITIAMFIFILFETQMASSFMRNYYDYKKQNRLEYLLGNILIYYFLGYLILCVMTILLYKFYPQNSYFNIYYILPIVLYIFPKQIFDIYAIKLRMENESKKYLYYTTLKIFTIAIFGITTVIFIEATPQSILWSIFLGNLIFGILGYIYLKQEIGIKPTYKYTKSSLYFGVPIMFVVLANWLMSSAGKFFIVTYLSLEKLAVYSIALKIGILYLLFSQVFKIVWDPIAIKNFSDINNKEIYAKALIYYFGIGSIFAVIIYLNTPTIINLMATSKYTDANSLAIFILLAFFWRGAIIIVASGNAWVKKTYFDLYSSIIGSVVGIAVIYMFIETYLLKAIVIGEFLAAFISFLLTLHFAQKNIKINYNYLLIAIFAIFSFLLVFYFA